MVCGQTCDGLYRFAFYLAVKLSVSAIIYPRWTDTQGRSSDSVFGKRVLTYWLAAPSTGHFCNKGRICIVLYTCSLMTASFSHLYVRVIEQTCLIKTFSCFPWRVPTYINFLLSTYNFIITSRLLYHSDTWSSNSVLYLKKKNIYGNKLYGKSFGMFNTNDFIWRNYSSRANWCPEWHSIKLSSCFTKWRRKHSRWRKLYHYQLLPLSG